jgi:hypothetical protein
MKSRIYYGLIILLFANCSSEQTHQIEKSHENLIIEASVSVFCMNDAPEIGTFQNQLLREGGFSGLHYIPGSDLEFYIVTDRGPNVSLKNLPNVPKDEHVMFFPFPDYSQKIMRIKLEDSTIRVLEIHPIKDFNKNPVHGLPVQRTLTEGKEQAWIDFKGTQAAIHYWSLDAEGITLGNDNDIWITDEYRTSIIQLNKSDMSMRAIYTPEPTSEDEFVHKLNSEFLNRQPNRGFESIAFTPSGKVVAMLQSPLYDPLVSDSTPSRLIRILELNPKTGKTKMFGYETDINFDAKIGDMTAINDHEFLVIEHGKDSTGKTAHVYKIDLEYATDISTVHFNMGTSFESLLNNSKAQYRGMILAQKTHVLDLIKAGFNPEFGKPEGLTIIDESRVAVINDNDFGINTPDSTGAVQFTNEPSCLYLFTFNQAIFKK